MIHGKDVLAQTNIHNHIIVNPIATSSPPLNDLLTVRCELEALPFLSESLDAAVLFHALEFVKDPKTVLDELYRSLINGGYLIVLGFNPRSIWGIKKLLQKSNKKIWGGNWITPHKMHKLLHEAGFDTGDYQTCYFRPPTKKMLFMEGLGQIFWPYSGASYMFVAQKTSIPLTPIMKFKNLKRKTPAINTIPESTTRSN